MSALGIDIDLATDFLEDHWGDELRCEHDHLGAEGEPLVACTITVTHRWVGSCGAAPDNICAALAEVVRSDIAINWERCSECMRRCAECWSVIPV